MDHCCKEMKEAVEFECPEHPARFDCPDALIGFWSRQREYGLLIHDGGSSMSVIDFCPWCGTKLPESRRAPSPTLSSRRRARAG